jgi:rhodanese-related sulfurtransferase
MNTLTANELKSKHDQNGNLKVINTLSPELFEKTHIPDSINIPLENPEFVSEVEKIVKKNEPVVVYCASLQCDSSTTAARKLEQAGFSQVFDFEGGAKEWEEAGMPLATASTTS